MVRDANANRSHALLLVGFAQLRCTFVSGNVICSIAVSQLTAISSILVVHPSVPAKNVREFAESST